MKVPLLIVLFILGCAEAQNITNKAMRTLFKYANTNATDKLTTALNKDNTIAAKIKRVTTWIETNLVKKGATVPKGAIEGNKTAMITRVKGFLNQRESLQKLINKLCDAVKTVLSAAKVNEMKKLFWNIDKERNNDLQLTEPEFYSNVNAVIPKNKQIAALTKMDTAKKDYLSKNPTEAKNLQWTFKTATSG
ncbi:unnamed protein product [Strongylus vulgaris]|uniref:SXP/RAL-2 family protein Ani s 5-like cation-binding domain-containing protein n=1 Tax=Strongylus vulgaris TaxID=40348 RepID=A0A3P7IHF0_STRVU|nr:unnamed protein product [Strongylus vulgaris]